MAASVDLVTVAEVNTYLGLSGTTHDVLIAELIDLTSEFIEDYCNTYFSATSTAEKVDGGDEFLIINRAPIGSITSIVDNTDASTVSASAYDFYADQGVVYKEIDSVVWPDGSETWAGGRQRYTVTYSAGHAAVPEAVKWVAYKLIERSLKQLPSSNNKGRWTQPDIVNVDRPTLFGMLTMEDKALLARYRHRAL